MKSRTMIVILACLSLSLVACTGCQVTPEQQTKIATASVECGLSLAAAAGPCVKACKVDPKAISCEKTCVDVVVGGAGPVCATAFGSLKSLEFADAVSNAVKVAIALYDAIREVPATPPASLETPDAINPTTILSDVTPVPSPTGT